MPDIALYYPYTHIRDDAWLKAAALYLPRLALMAPAGYPRRLSPTAEILRAELGFLIDVDPAGRTEAVATEFLQLLDREGDALRARYAWPAEFPASLRKVLTGHGGYLGCWQEHTPCSQVEWVHVGKIQPHLVDVLLETRLGVPSDDRFWVALHPRLASVYLATLAERIAQANLMPVVTDQSFAYGALNGWQLDTLAYVLLGDDSGERPEGHSPIEVAALYAALAIRAVVPECLSGIPAERIVKARQTLAAEFDAFCVHLDSMADQFAELARIEDMAILRARLDLLAGRDLRQPVADLEVGLRKLGLEPARGVLGMKTLQLPALAAAAAAGIGLPVAAGQGGMVAAQFVASSIQAYQSAQERRRSAAGYLLGLHRELSPRGVVDRVRRMFRRASFRAAKT